MGSWFVNRHSWKICYAMLCYAPIGYDVCVCTIVHSRCAPWIPFCLSSCLFSGSSACPSGPWSYIKCLSWMLPLLTLFWRDRLFSKNVALFLESSGIRVKQKPIFLQFLFPNYIHPSFPFGATTRVKCLQVADDFHQLHAFVLP